MVVVKITLTMNGHMNIKFITNLSEEFGVSVFGVVKGKYFPVLLTELGRDISVGRATRYGLDGPEIESR
jgi:hypothetical protein